MITGFNPADMYAKAHIKRVLQTFPGVFTGIGEFTVHKEFVSSKVAGEVASLSNPALDSILDFAGEVGLVVVFHNDMDMPFAKAGTEPVFLDQMKAVLKRHPRTTIIWAHIGLGRIVHPVQQSGSQPVSDRNPNHIKIVEEILTDPAFNHVYFDISWDEVAKYIVATPQGLQNTINLINRFPDRFLFGTDVVSPTSSDMYLGVFRMYAPLWKGLTPETSEKVRKGNYIRLFDAARIKVRAWETKNK
jgi:predicted TIM-barrel fold metal-dependent hydrolase